MLGYIVEQDKDTHAQILVESFGIISLIITESNLGLPKKITVIIDKICTYVSFGLKQTYFHTNLL